VRNLLNLRGICSLFPFGIGFASRVVCYHDMFRNRNGIFALSLGLAFCLAKGAAFANGMRVVSQDGFATARGDAFVATADNASAVYYNPAGISQLEGDQIRSGIYGIYFDPTFRPPDTAPNSGTTYHVKKKEAVAPQLFYTHEIKDTPFTFGFGSYAPYGAGLEWPDDTGFYSVGKSSQITYLRVNPVLSVKVLPGLSVAAGVMADYSKIELKQGLSFDATSANYFKYNGDGFSMGYNIGVLWQAHSTLSVGATFRSATKFSTKGQTEFESQPFYPVTRQNADAEFEFPLTAAAGISWRPSHKWNLEVNVDYTDWSTFDSITIHQANPTPLFAVPQDMPVDLYWNASWIYSAGVTRYFDNGWNVSAGYSYNQNSVPDTYYSPLVADLNRHFISCGVGFIGEKYQCNIAYQFGYGVERTITRSLPSTPRAFFTGQTADGTYDFVSHAVLMTVGIRF
jgi:long-chain fatty acid transport protein